MGRRRVEAFLMRELRSQRLSDSNERALLKGLGMLELSFESQEVLLARVDAAARNPQARFDTLQAVMLQGTMVSQRAFFYRMRKRELPALQLTRLGATLFDTIVVDGSESVDVMTELVKQAVQVPQATYAAEASGGLSPSFPSQSRTPFGRCLVRMAVKSFARA